MTILNALKTVHIAARLLGTAYVIGFVGYNIIRYYQSKRNLPVNTKDFKRSMSGRKIKIYYGSQSGMTKDLSLKVHDQLCQQYPFHLIEYPLSISKFQDLDDLLKESLQDYIYIFLVSTFIDGEEPSSCKWFYQSLKDNVNDFRVSKSSLSNLVYVVCGVGDTAYKDNFCLAALTLHDYLSKLGGKSINYPNLVDISAAELPVDQILKWVRNLSPLLQGSNQYTVITPDNGRKQQIEGEEPNEVEKESSEDDISSNESESDEKAETTLPDIEDLALNRKIDGDSDNGSSSVVGTVGRFITKNKNDVVDYSKFTKEQINERLRIDLTKQGYKLIESHSAVKLCRWTKNSLRGRGGCYKHTFYGIQSYQCMEITPNLACASKCTFCWRHHKNPVGTEWKWKMDEPDIIISQGIENHLKMIKQLKGVPGVLPERFEDAMRVRHCALSLVGEPIFYPKINEFLNILHEKCISSFLVTNAQFPDAMRTLVPVTQLYVSIDASNKDSLKKIDRPLYQDYWQRFLDCLQIISEKKQRTVFRLTLVKRLNIDEVEGYAKLVRLGMPDLIEIKGVTFCGSSKSNTLTMDNVPWHQEVVDFSQQLVSCLPKDSYELACEHKHSNCTLIANTKFKVNGRWHTWINYEKFFNLLEQFVISGQDFDSSDYMAETPEWAVFDSDHHGFDPLDERFIRNQHKKNLLEQRLNLSKIPTVPLKETPTIIC